MLALLMLAGCGVEQLRTMNPTRSVTATGETLPRSEVGLLAYCNYLAGLDARQLQEELDLARKQYELRRDSYNQLRLAVLLMQPGTPFRNDGEAAGLLNDYIQSGEAEGGPSGPKAPDSPSYENRYQVLALFLLNTLTRRQQLEEELVSVRRKLEQLKAIERQLIQPDDRRDGS